MHNASIDAADDDGHGVESCGCCRFGALLWRRTTAESTLLATMVTAWRRGPAFPPPRWPGGAARLVTRANRVHGRALPVGVDALATARAGIDPAGNRGHAWH